MRPTPSVLAVVCALTLFGGCASRPALRRSFNDYGDVYADTQNRQMLLNLARLHEHEPTYFFQLTQISASYTFTSQLGLGDNKEIGLTNNGATNFHVANGTLSGTATHQPVFTLVPLAGDKFAQQLLQPIKPEVFYDLYEEGWPIDLLMRVLIEKIEIFPDAVTGDEVPAEQAGLAHGREGRGRAGETAVSEPKKDDRTEILENDPWQGIRDPKDPVDVAPDGPKGHYDRFLRACALAREYQRHGLLYLAVGDSETKPGAKQAKVAEEPQDEAKALTSLLKTLTSALQKGASEEGSGTSPPKAGGAAGKSGQPGKDFYFQIIANDTSFALCNALAEQKAYWGWDDPINRFNLLVFKGFEVADKPQGNGPFRVRLIMRSLITVMNALANEGDGFRLFRDYFQGDGGGEIARRPARPAPPRIVDIRTISKTAPIPLAPQGEPLYWAPLPDLEDHATLDLIPTSATRIGHVVAELNYAGRHYVVADPPDLPGQPSSTQNRDVFRLLVQLSFLATTDPAAYATPSLIQLH